VEKKKEKKEKWKTGEKKTGKRRDSTSLPAESAPSLCANDNQREVERRRVVSARWPVQMQENVLTRERKNKL
jgi:hypothetical protein